MTDSSMSAAEQERRWLEGLDERTEQMRRDEAADQAPEQEREALLADLAKVIPNSDGVLWEMATEDGEPQPITLSEVVRTFERHGWCRPAPEQEAVSDEVPGGFDLDAAKRHADPSDTLRSEISRAVLERLDREDREAVSDAAVEAAARRRWRNDHGSINSPDHLRTPESDERERDETGFGGWDHGIVAESVKDWYRRKARTELTAALPHLTRSPAEVDAEVDAETIQAAWSRAMEAGELPRARGASIYVRDAFEVGYRAARVGGAS